MQIYATCSCVGQGYCGRHCNLYFPLFHANFEALRLNAIKKSYTMALYRGGRGGIEIERFLKNTQAVLGQIVSFSQQWETQNTNLDDLENAAHRMTEICTMFHVLYMSLPANSAANNSVIGLMSILDAIRTNISRDLMV